MPKFYFDVREDSRLTSDIEGMELRDSASATREAIDTATLMAKDVLSSGQTERIAIEVRDDDHAVCSVCVSLKVNGT